MKYILILLIPLFINSCWNDNEDCDCGTITNKGINQDNESYVVLTTDCDSTTYLTDSTYQIGDQECKDNLSILNLIIEK